ncbi:MAG TPA: BNR repeat-containing protein [Polyangiaceae bacterium]|nr:BNR repeat-containing protein [Polyangiaceae bacterium]
MRSGYGALVGLLCFGVGCSSPESPSMATGGSNASGGRTTSGSQGGQPGTATGGVTSSGGLAQGGAAGSFGAGAGQDATGGTAGASVSTAGRGGGSEGGGAGSTSPGGTSNGGTTTAGGATDRGGTGGGSNAQGGSGTSGAGTSGQAGSGGQGGGVTAPIAETVPIAKVWSGHPVGFYLLTHKDRQFVAFYDENRALTVGVRKLGSRDWQLTKLATSVGWDSHNDIVMAVDSTDILHVAGNMHSSALIYFRSKSALDPSTLERVTNMVGKDETACTYPQFFLDSRGELVFMYRSGESGNGNHIFNSYDTQTKQWSRLLNSALTDGQGQRNAYPVGPIQGPDGFWHLVWVWRETADARTNHDLSYARTQDLKVWQSAAGKTLNLPITLASSDIVDAVPQNAGMINNNTKVGFDSMKRPIVAYHKFDAAGNTQLYNARFENGKWVSHLTSNWNYRWDFGGNGTLVFEIEVQPVELQPDGTLTQSFYHAKFGGLGAFRLNENTLASEASIAPPVPYPADLAKVESKEAGMEVRFRKDANASADPNLIYMLRWETLPSNRDQPRDPPYPAPSELRLYAFPIKR